MRLYTRTGATQVDDPTHGTFTVGPDGAFDFPDEVSDRLHSFHVAGSPAWESDAERAKRLLDEQMEKLRDPATLLATMQEMARGQRDLAAALLGQQSDPGTAPGKTASESHPVEAAAAAARADATPESTSDGDSTQAAAKPARKKAAPRTTK